MLQMARTQPILLFITQEVTIKFIHNIKACHFTIYVIELVSRFTLLAFCTVGSLVGHCLSAKAQLSLLRK